MITNTKEQEIKLLDRALIFIREFKMNLLAYDIGRVTSVTVKFFGDDVPTEINLSETKKCLDCHVEVFNDRDSRLCNKDGTYHICAAGGTADTPVLETGS